MNAIFSPCGRYRRQLIEGGPHFMGWCMCNPSIAGSVDDEGKVRDDPTAGRVRDFTRRFGYSGHVIGNVYDFVATNPEDLNRSGGAACSPENDAYLLALATLPLVVVAWGKPPLQVDVIRTVKLLTAYGAELWCLGRNQDGSPKHPLYLAASTQLERWTP